VETALASSFSSFLKDAPDFNIYPASTDGKIGFFISIHKLETFAYKVQLLTTTHTILKDART
jgi:hypothetical protein